MNGVAGGEMKCVLLEMRLDELDSSLGEVRKSMSPQQRGLFEGVRLGNDDWQHLELQFGQEVIDLRKDIVAARKIADLDEAWTRYSDIYQRSRRVIRESLELMGGLVLRERSLDGGICEVAEELIRTSVGGSLNQKFCLAIPALEEVLAKTTSGLTRLRFPEWSIWTLPLVMHEYACIASERRFDDKCVGVDAHLPKDLQPFATCLLADAFATYLIGPAYACAALMLRLHPSLAEYRPDTVPLPIDRAAVILDVLHRMNGPVSKLQDPPYERIHRLVCQSWSRLVPQARHDQSAVRLKEFLDAVWECFEGKLFTAQYPSGEGPYGGWGVAAKWSAVWETAVNDNQLPEPIQMPRNAKLRDVVNAAWRYRMGRQDHAVDVAKAAHQMCKEILSNSGARVVEEVPGQRQSMSGKARV